MSAINDTETLRHILTDCKTIAVVGLSPNATRASHFVARYMKDYGYRIIPVNPGHRELLGETCYPDLASIPDKVDMVNVFRRPGDCPPIAEAAVAIGARVLWMQMGIENDEALRIAEAGGLQVVMDRCLKVDFGRLMR